MAGFAVGGNKWDYFEERMWLTTGGIGGSWCQVMEGLFDALSVIKEIKKPLW